MAKYGWQFFFQGTNINAERTADQPAIVPDLAVNSPCEGAGILLNYKGIGQAAAAVRCAAGYPLKNAIVMDSCNCCPLRR